MQNEIRQARVRNERRKSPLREKRQTKSRGSADRRQKGRTPSRAKPRPETEQRGRQDERVKSLPGNPEKDQVTNHATPNRAEQPSEDDWILITARHRKTISINSPCGKQKSGLISTGLPPAGTIGPQSYI